MIRMILKDINLTGYFSLPLQCFPLRNFNCNDDCLARLGYPTVSLTSPHGTDEYIKHNISKCNFYLYNSTEKILPGVQSYCLIFI